MLAIDRQRAILDRIEVGGSVRTAEMAEILEVTEETIRRDFEKLEEAGHIKRAHGGALKPAIGGPWRDLPFGERHSYQVAEKENVARAALDEVSEGQVLFLDASSTVLHLARNLPDVQLTVITNALQVLWSLRNRSKLTVLSTGGRGRATSSARGYLLLLMSWNRSGARFERGQRFTRGVQAPCHAERGQINMSRRSHEIGSSFCILFRGARRTGSYYHGRRGRFEHDPKDPIAGGAPAYHELGNPRRRKTCLFHCRDG